MQMFIECRPSYTENEFVCTAAQNTSTHKVSQRTCIHVRVSDDLLRNTAQTRNRNNHSNPNQDDFLFFLFFGSLKARRRRFVREPNIFPTIQLELNLMRKSYLKKFQDGFI